MSDCTCPLREKMRAWLESEKLREMPAKEEMIASGFITREEA